MEGSAEIKESPTLHGLNVQKAASSLSGYRVTLVLLLIVSAGLNVVLSYKTLQFYNHVKLLNDAIQQLSIDNQAHPGDWVPPLDAINENGQRSVISYSKGSRPTIVYVFSPQCDWCKENLTTVKVLANQTAGQYRFVGLSLTEKGVREYADKNQIKFPIYTSPSTTSLSFYRIGRTPQTLVISADGRIVKNWQGAYVGDTMREIREFFAVDLPPVGRR